jgi:hypothetical protein
MFVFICKETIELAPTTSVIAVVTATIRRKKNINADQKSNVIKNITIS